MQKKESTDLPLLKKQLAETEKGINNMLNAIQTGIFTPSTKQRLIDSFVNAVYLYEDKIILTFNYKDGSKTITLADVEGSDLSSFGAPSRSKLWIACSDLFYMSERAHAAAPPFQTEPAYAGLRFGAALCAAFFLSVLTVCSKFESHVLAN